MHKRLNIVDLAVSFGLKGNQSDWSGAYGSAKAECRTGHPVSVQSSSCFYFMGQLITVIKAYG